MIKKLFVFIILSIFLNCALIAQENNSKSKASIEQLANYYLTNNKDSSFSLSEITKEQMYEMFLRMIENGREGESYKNLFEWLTNNGVDINKKITTRDILPIELALSEHEEIPAFLLIKNGADIPETISIPEYCGNADVSPLALAIEMKDYALIEGMLERGVIPDSLSYEMWFNKVDNEMVYLLFKYHQDTSIELKRGNIVDYCLRYRQGFKLNIDPINTFRENYKKLVIAVENNNSKKAELLIDGVFSFINRYGYQKNNNSNPLSHELSGLIFLAIDYNSYAIFDKLFEYDMISFIYDLNDLNQSIPNNLLRVLSERNYTDSIFSNQTNSKNPFIQDACIKYNYPVDKITINTREFLLNGKSAEWLLSFYKNENTNSPNVFMNALEGNMELVNEFLTKNNPFIKDNYGLSLFELMLFIGMEKQIIQVMDENKYLPIEKEGIYLALLTSNKVILDKLSEKTILSEYSSYFYSMAIGNNNQLVIDWLGKNKLSAKNCGGLKNTPEVAKSLGNVNTMQTLINRGFSTNYIFEDYYMHPYKLSQQRKLSNFSLLAHATIHNNKEVIKLLLNHQRENNIEIDSLLMFYAVLFSEPETIKMLADNGISISKEMEKSITPLELAIRLDKKNSLKQLIELGINCNTLIDSLKQEKGKLHTYTDYSGSYSILNYLIDHGGLYTPYGNFMLLDYIKHQENDKAMALIKKYSYLPSDYFLNKAYWAKNKSLVIELMSDSTYNIHNLINGRFKEGEFWFIDYCMENPQYAKQLYNYTDNNGNTLLHLAVEFKNMYFLKYLLENGFDVHKANNKGYTIYYIVSENDRYPNKAEAIELIEKHGGKVAYSEEVLNNSYIDAVSNNNIDKVRKYLSMGADPNLEVSISTSTSYYNTSFDTVPSLYAALSKNNSLMAHLLLLHGANPNPVCTQESFKGKSPLSIAIDNRMYDAARMLIYKGADLNFIPKSENNKSCEKEMPLIELITEREIKELMFCLPAKNVVDEMANPDSLIIKAFKQEDKELLADLIKSEGISFFKYGKCDKSTFWQCSLDFQIYVFNKYYTPEDIKNVNFLQEPLEYGSAELIEYLVSTHNYKKEEKSSLYRQYNPITYAIRKGSRLFALNSIYKSLPFKNDNQTNYNNDVNIVIRKTKSLLKHTNFHNSRACFITAVKSRLYELIPTLFEYDNTSNSVKDAFLDVINGDEKALSSKLAKGLSANTEIHNFSLFACAAWVNNTKIANLLVEHGALLNASNYDPEYRSLYHSVEFWAVINGNIEITKHCKKLGATFDNLFIPNENICFASAFTLLMVQEDKQDALIWMLDEGLIHHSIGNNAHTLLSQAILFDDYDLMKLLIQYPPDPSYYLDYEGFGYYAPKNASECLTYAISEDSENCFFSMIEANRLDTISVEGWSLNSCYGPKIITWLLKNSSIVLNETLFVVAIEKATSYNDSLLLSDILSLKTDEFIQNSVKNNSYKFSAVAEKLIKSESFACLNLLATFLPKFTIKDLEEAIEKNNLKSIGWLIYNGTSWMESNGWEKRYAPNITQNYETWKYATEKIIEVKGFATK